MCFSVSVSLARHVSRFLSRTVGCLYEGQFLSGYALDCYIDLREGRK